MYRHVIALVVPIILICATGAAAPAQPRTAAAVIATDSAWTEAEIRGDAAYVEALLLPEYQSVGQGGKITNKAQIVASTRKRGNYSNFGAEVAAYRKDHPTRSDVVIVGNTAVLTWVSLVVNRGEPVASCDIFIYRQGQWHALYSQHTMAEA